MTDKQTPPDWVLIEAAKRSGIEGDAEFLRRYYNYTVHGSFVALCDMIQKYEQPPVDRKVLCAREAVRESGYHEDDYAIVVGVRAIELYEEGFGK